nr:single-stranded DNA-binding protein [Anaerolineae bacterium]
NQYLSKGQQVYVEGRLQTRGWEDEEGKKHYRTELVANEMIVLGDRRSQPLMSSNDEPDPSEDDEDVAF